MQYDSPYLIRTLMPSRERIKATCWAINSASERGEAMPYILLIIFLTANGRLQHVDSVPFDDAFACESAMNWMRPMAADNVTMQCVAAANAKHPAP